MAYNKSLWDILQHRGLVYLILFIISFNREGVLGIKVSQIKLCTVACSVTS